MKIGVISDTHGDLAAIRRAVSALGYVDCWLHAGDYSKDRFYLADLSGVPVYAVQGNCDMDEDTALVDEYITVENKKIWLTHGHKYEAKNREKELVWWSKQYNVDIVVYGHSHVPRNLNEEDILIFNPGSPSRPRGGSKQSCGLLTITKNSVQAELFEIPHIGVM